MCGANAEMMNNGRETCLVGKEEKKISVWDILIVKSAHPQTIYIKETSEGGC